MKVGLKVMKDIMHGLWTSYMAVVTATDNILLFNLLSVGHL